MKTITMVAAAAVLLPGCSTSTQQTEPEFDVTYSDADVEAVVQVDSADRDEVEAAVQFVVDGLQKSKDDGGWFIFPTCGPSGFNNDGVGQGRFALGQAGAAQTGLEEGTFDFEFYDTDSPCG